MLNERPRGRNYKNDLNDILSYNNLQVVHWENRKRQPIIPLNEGNLSSLKDEPNNACGTLFQT